jgi:hypothetical protein
LPDSKGHPVAFHIHLYIFKYHINVQWLRMMATKSNSFPAAFSNRLYPFFLLAFVGANPIQNHFPLAAIPSAGWKPSPLIMSRRI